MSQPKENRVQIKLPEDISKGFYSNFMQIMHTKEEFIFDFMNVIGSQGIVGSRVIMHPAHAKRVVAALNENIKKYEEQFGTINEGESQGKTDFGFKTQS